MRELGLLPGSIFAPLPADGVRPEPRCVKRLMSRPSNRHRDGVLAVNDTTSNHHEHLAKEAVLPTTSRLRRPCSAL